MISLVPILISHFIFNLRQTGESAQPPSRPSHVASLVFRLQESIVGNMGESLNHGFDEQAEDAGEGMNEESIPLEEVGDASATP